MRIKLIGSQVDKADLLCWLMNNGTITREEDLVDLSPALLKKLEERRRRGFSIVEE